ncbi:hypothetical protein LM601598_10510 [Listeria monocytogenes]|nr:hypothetical protein LM601598_10510 [Listeria monocytogenes]
MNATKTSRCQGQILDMVLELCYFECYQNEVRGGNPGLRVLELCYLNATKTEATRLQTHLEF